MMLEQITPLILTWNEAQNIGRTLERLSWAHDIVVVDSFSNDETLGIVSSFPQTRIFQRAFDSHDNQWNFGLRETGIRSGWVMALDADYILTAELIDEIDGLQPARDVHGYCAPVVYCIGGRELKSAIYPPPTFLYRREPAEYYLDGHTQRLRLPGRVDTLRSAFLHDDRKPLSDWLAAQLRYTALEATKLVNTDAKDLNTADRIRKLRVIAPPAIFFYCLLRGGLLDGWAGIYYALQRAFNELLLSLRLFEHDFTAQRTTHKDTRACPESLKSDHVDLA